MSAEYHEPLPAGPVEVRTVFAGLMLALVLALALASLDQEMVGVRLKT